MSLAFERLLQDLRFGARILITSPALSATAVLLVALVIGGNTTVFSIAHGILRKPAPGVQGEGLVTLNWVDETGRADPGSSYATFEDLVAQSATLRPLVAVQPFGRFTLSHENGSHAVRGGLVSAAYLDHLGVRLAAGRGLTRDDVAASGLSMVISHRLWQEHFQGGDIAGRAVFVNGHAATMVGVASPGFRGTLLGESADIWLPLVSYARASGQQQSLVDRSEDRVIIHGRLAADTSLAQARAEITAIWAGVQAAHPEQKRQQVTLVPYSATAGTATGIADQGDRLLAILMVVTLLTLVIVCANVANLLVARAVVRQREMALRQSLGASRVRILRMLFAEGLVIASIAGATAFLCAWWVSRAASGFIAPGGLALVDFTPDWTVAGYAAGLALVSVLAFTVAPAIRAWRLELLPWLAAGAQGVIQGRSRLSSVLVVVQLAFSVLLLTSAGLVHRSIFLVKNLDIGFDTANLLLVTVTTAGSATSPETNAVLLDSLRDRVRGVPGVDSASYARQPPREGWWDSSVSVPGSTSQPVRAERNHVGPDYFKVHGVTLVAGREFDSGDRTRPSRSAVISQRLAGALWPGQSPLGRRLVLSQESDARGVPPYELEVVGVTPDAFFSGFRRDHRRFVFLSAEQAPAPPGETTLYARFTGALDRMGPAVARALQQADARTPIVSMQTWDAQLATIAWPARVLTMLLTIFACGSLLIAGIGQYAVVAFDMRRRLRELGLRLALGASSTQIQASVVREGFWLTCVGLAIGFALSMATGRGLAGVLYGITPTDPATYASVFGLLSTASLLACYLPARRAARIDPIAVLRND